MVDTYTKDLWEKHYNRKLDSDSDKLFYELCAAKDVDDLTWQDIADVYNHITGENYSCDYFRKRIKREETENCTKESNEDVIEYLKSKQLCDDNKAPDDKDSFSELDWKIFDLNVSKWKKSDERIQLNALYRRIAREISIREMAKDIVSKMTDMYTLPPVEEIELTHDIENNGILQISDWHYGVEVDSIYNTFNCDIAKTRVHKLLIEAIKIIKMHNLKHLDVVNLGDLIAGRIHLQLRINSRIDVITQVIEVTELLAELLNYLSEFVRIDYFDTMDNHSRLEPNLKDSIELESLTRVTRWYLEERLKDNRNIKIHTENEYGDDIITFTRLRYEIAGVHGHKDKPVKIIDNLSMMTKKHYDLILSSHLHHFSADEKNETVLVSNSSLMGTDEFAQSLRLTSKPSQNFIIMTKENPVYCIHKINL